MNLISMDVLIDYFKNIFDSKIFPDETILPGEKLDFINNLLKLSIHSQLPGNWNYWDLCYFQDLLKDIF